MDLKWSQHGRDMIGTRGEGAAGTTGAVILRRVRYHIHTCLKGTRWCMSSVSQQSWKGRTTTAYTERITTRPGKLKNTF